MAELGQYRSSQIGRQDAYVHLEVIGQHADHLPAKRSLAGKYLGDRRLGNSRLSAHVRLRDGLGSIR